MKKILGLFICLLIINCRQATAADNFLNPEWWKTATVKQVQAKIKNGVNVNAKDKNGKTVLMYATTHNNNPEVIKTLITAGADINAKDENDKTPLIYAAEHTNNPGIIKALLAVTDINTTNTDLMTATMVATINNSNPEIAKTLITETDINVKSNIKTSNTVNSSNNKTIDHLKKITSDNFLNPDWWKTATIKQVQSGIKNGADINAIDENGKTVLMYAVSFNKNPEIIKTLLAAGADVNAKYKDGTTALMFAAKHNTNPKIVKVLIAAGADINAKNKNGNTALMFAAKHNTNPKIVNILRQMCKTDSLMSDLKKTILHGAAFDSSCIHRLGKAFWLLQQTSNGTFAHVPNWISGTYEDMIIFIEKNDNDSNINSDSIFNELQDGYVLPTGTYQYIDSGNIKTVYKFKRINEYNINTLLNPNWWQTATMEKVQAEIKNGADVNAKLSPNEDVTAFTLASAYNNDLEIIKALIAVGADVNNKPKTGGWTPLIAAASHNSPEIVKTLIAVGADINAQQNINGWTPLISAVFHKKQENVLVLINAGANVNITDIDGHTALMWTIKHNSNLQVIKALLAAGADVNAKDKDGETALTLAKEKNNPEIIDLLLAAGVKTTSNKTTSNKFLNSDWWEIATLEKVKTEIKKGSNVNVKNKYGMTPLMFASGNSKNPEIIKELIATGADVNAKTKLGETALMLAVKERGNKNTIEKIVKALLIAGADVNMKDAYGGQTALHKAVYDNKNPEIIKMLIEAGADVNTKNKFGTTPLMIAVSFYSSNLEIVKILLAAGADVNIKDENNKTALRYVVNSEIFHLLLSAGAK